MDTRCVRCGSTKDLEEDHIIQKSRGGTDEPSNKRILCQACHDYRHTRDNIMDAIDNQLSVLGTEHFNSVKFSMWIMRLGVLEAFNTPEKIKERGSYMPYWDVPTTHYSRWYPKIKLQKLNRMKAKELTKTLLEFSVNRSYANGTR